MDQHCLPQKWTRFALDPMCDSDPEPMADSVSATTLDLDKIPTRFFAYHLWWNQKGREIERNSGKFRSPVVTSALAECLERLTSDVNA
ncbi:hypothetical protein OUZ56_012167 [Daphnia magna]|uniref:Uncharacterized protein n=1 Tax=Daphnia magna TaxID=35525 RepID=A0ABQ9Z2A7_9CRUS|nr:hypothetical protein OUZ56_012167 [Daphnia magna]